jgi:hypothetical protein
MRCKANALLEINHCLEQQAYVDWKYQHLADLVRTPPKARIGNGSRLAYRFTTLSLPELTPYYRAWYRGGKKVVADMELSSLSLAVWFMDDGCKSQRALYLNTQQFSVEDQMRLVRMLREQWAIDSALNRDRHYYRLRISVSSVARFREVVAAHMLEQFAYKFPEMTP